MPHISTLCNQQKANNFGKKLTMIHLFHESLQDQLGGLKSKEEKMGMKSQSVATS
ncbi:putative Polycomb group protein ASXL3 isoform X1 [Sesbania bispinosa]|nr:putative Polycomb group protein ASXL3 isoform X1 [Sesbania bispinosa]